jgi:predicted membrane chloride channel (bestrophin family)
VLEVAHDSFEERLSFRDSAIVEQILELQGPCERPLFHPLFLLPSLLFSSVLFLFCFSSVSVPLLQHSLHKTLIHKSSS